MRGWWPSWTSWWRRSSRAKEIDYGHPEIDPALRAWGDPDRMRQILLNLLANAVKFTPARGRIAVSAGREGAQVEIRVEDTGRGIPADRLEAIFDPFVQVDRRGMEESQQGVGLGLAISRELARTMEGDLVAESRVGSGSCFRLRLPAVEG